MVPPWVTASRFLAGNIEAEVIPPLFLHSYFLRFFRRLYFPLFFFLFFTNNHDFLSFSLRLVLTLRPPARLPCAATRSVGGRLTWYLELFPWLRLWIAMQCFGVDSPPRREAVVAPCCQSARHGIYTLPAGSRVIVGGTSPFWSRAPSSPFCCP